MSPNFSSSLERAILETLAYSDVFDYPLTFDELHRYLTFPSSKEELKACLDSLSSIASEDGYYFLPNRSGLVQTRRQREQTSLPAFSRALKYGRILGTLPFVRMVALTGSLAVLNLSNDADMDYMLVTPSGRLWLARAIAVTFGRFMRLFGDRICVNLLVSESNLKWNVQDLYSARELCQMIPITGMGVYLDVRKHNDWTNTFLPNAESMPEITPQAVSFVSRLQRMLESLLQGNFGSMLEAWTMNFQLKKIRRTYGTGLEANFSVDLCQGNFHDHRNWTNQSLRERLAVLNEREHH